MMSSSISEVRSNSSLPSKSSFFCHVNRERAALLHLDTKK